MNEEDSQRIIRLLEEIRDGQRLQLERQAQAMERQAEALALQRQRLADVSQSARGAEGIGAQAGRVLGQSAKLVSSARVLVWVLASFVLSLFAFVFWALWAQVMR